MPNLGMIREEETKETTIDDSFYNVIMHNDPKTWFEYVEWILNEVFNYNDVEAEKIALYIHKHGQAIVATCSESVAYEKMELVNTFNEIFEQCLQVSVEEA